MWLNSNVIGDNTLSNFDFGEGVALLLQCKGGEGVTSHDEGKTVSNSCGLCVNPLTSWLAANPNGLLMIKTTYFHVKRFYSIAHNFVLCTTTPKYHCQNLMHTIKSKLKCVLLNYIGVTLWHGHESKLSFWSVSSMIHFL